MVAYSIPILTLTYGHTLSVRVVEYLKHSWKSWLGAEPPSGTTPKPAVTGQVADIAAVWQGQTLQYQIIMIKIYACHFFRQEEK